MDAVTSWTLPSGAHVHTWVPAGPPRAVVLLQHGFTEHAHRYVEQHHGLIPGLLERGYAVWGMDLLGHGRSPGPHRITDVRRAVADHVLVRARLRSGGVPTVLFGHSLGGLVTAGSVAADPSHLSGVVLSSPALVSAVPAAVRMAALLLGRTLPRVPVPGRARPRRDVADMVGQDPLMRPGPVPMLVGATALAVSARLWRYAPRWQTPTLLLHGTADAVTDPDQTRRFAAAVAATDTTLHLVDGGQHELLNDLPAAGVLDLVLTWIDHRTAPALYQP